MIRTAICALALTLVQAVPALAEVMVLRQSAGVTRTEYDLDRFMELIMDDDRKAVLDMINDDTAAFNQATRDVYVYHDVIDARNVRIRLPGDRNSYYTRKFNVIAP